MLKLRTVKLLLLSSALCATSSLWAMHDQETLPPAPLSPRSQKQADINFGAVVDNESYLGWFDAKKMSAK